MHLGNFTEDSTHYFFWNTNDTLGASVTRSTDGTVSVVKDGNYASRVATGVTDDEDEATGLHLCTLVLTDAFYVTGSDYSVVLIGAVIDGQTVNARLAGFSIENRTIPTSGQPKMGA